MFTDDQWRARGARRDRASGGACAGSPSWLRPPATALGGMPSRRTRGAPSSAGAAAPRSEWPRSGRRRPSGPQHSRFGAAGTPPPEQQTLSETPPAEAAAGGDPADPGGNRDAAAHRHEPGPVDRRGRCGHRGRRRAPRRRAGPRTDTRRTLSAHASASSNSAATRSSASRRVTSRSTSSASSEYARAIDFAMSGAV